MVGEIRRPDKMLGLGPISHFCVSWATPRLTEAAVCLKRPLASLVDEGSKQ